MTRPRATSSAVDELGAVIADLKARLVRVEQQSHLHGVGPSSLMIAYHVERNGGFSPSLNGAFGNGASDGFASFPFGVQMIYSTIAVTAAHTGSTTVQLLKNNALVGGVTHTQTGVGSSTVNWSSSAITFAAGDTFNWQCTATSGTVGTTTIVTYFRQSA